MATSTETKTETKTTVLSDTQCASLVSKINKKEGELSSLKVELAKRVKVLAGDDQEKANEILVASWLQGSDMAGKPETEVNAFLITQRTSISKIVRLAYPVETHVVDVAKAMKHNETHASKSERIGENKMIEIARGNLTFEDAKAGKSVPRKKAPKATGEADKNVPLPLQFDNRFSVLLSEYVKKGVALAEIEKICNTRIAEHKVKKA